MGGVRYVPDARAHVRAACCRTAVAVRRSCHHRYHPIGATPSIFAAILDGSAKCLIPAAVGTYCPITT